MQDVREFGDITVGDFVMYDDWVGQIQEVRFQANFSLPLLLGSNVDCSFSMTRSSKHQMAVQFVFRK